MATFAYNPGQYHSHTPSHSHNHHGRARRAPRLPSQPAHRHYKAQRSPKEVPDTRPQSEYVLRFDAARSFEFDDDEVFCPFHLLTEDDVRIISPPAAIHPPAHLSVQLQSIHSSSASERGSMSSDSPESSPLQQQIQPTAAFLLPTQSSAYHQSSINAHHQSHAKLHQPMAQRTRNAIPIVDPSTRSIASPPLSISPGRQMQQQYTVPRRW